MEILSRGWEKYKGKEIAYYSYPNTAKIEIESHGVKRLAIAIKKADIEHGEYAYCTLNAIYIKLSRNEVSHKQFRKFYG